MTVPAPTPPKNRALIGGASAAMVSQGVVAGSSLTLQTLALLELKNEGLGIFAILATGLLVTATAMHTGWVGDPIVLLDRHDPPIRRALVAASAISVVASFLFGLLGTVQFTSLGWDSGVLFGIAVTLWLIEESGRRLLMARLEFAKLVVNDVAYAVAALAVAASVTIWWQLTMNHNLNLNYLRSSLEYLIIWQRFCSWPQVVIEAVNHV